MFFLNFLLPSLIYICFTAEFLKLFSGGLFTVPKDSPSNVKVVGGVQSLTVSWTVRLLRFMAFVALCTLSMSFKYKFLFHSARVIIFFLSQIPSGVQCPAIGFKVIYSHTQGGDRQEVIVNNGQATSTTLTGLKKWTIYYVKVAVRNEKGFGPFSAEKDIRTTEEGTLHIIRSS